MEQNNIVEVSMAGMEIASSPSVLVTRGLGSCLGIAMYSKTKRIGALAHPMLPDINRSKAKTKKSKFVNSAIHFMLDELKKRGCAASLLEIKIVGGGSMFSFGSGSDKLLNIGARNVNKAREVIESLKLGITAEDVLDNYGKTVFFDLSTGKIKISTIFHGEKEL
jgi:chemotaxis protein CheD